MDITTIVLWTWILLCKGCVMAFESPFFFSPEGSNFSTSKTYCEDNIGRLVTLDTQAKYDRFMEADKTHHNGSIRHHEMYIGLSTASTDCTDYVWSSGKPLVWSKWDLSRKQPAECSTKQCVMLKSGSFSTTGCDTVMSAICEYGEFIDGSSLFISSTAMTWADSFLYCWMLGGRLAMIKDKEKQRSVLGDLRQHHSDSDSDYWIGLTSVKQSCIWIDKTAITWSNFNDGFNCVPGSCVALITNIWSFAECSGHDKALCEYGYEIKDSFLFDGTPSSWFEAELKCERLLGKLASLNTPERFIHASASYADYIQMYPFGVWIGLYTETPSCTQYTWVNGDQYEWAPWTNHELDWCEYDRCVRLSPRGFQITNCEVDLPALCLIVSSEPQSVSLTRETTTADTTEVTTTLTSVPVVEPTSSNTSCDCCARRQTNMTQRSHAELRDVIKQLKSKLSVSKNNTSIYQRKRISVYESRPSSVVMGVVAGVIMSVVIGWIVVPDIIVMFVSLYKFVNKQNVVTPRV